MLLFKYVFYVMQLGRLIKRLRLSPTCIPLDYSVNFNSTFNSISRKLSFARMSEKMKIGTHDSTFHCDEALACFLLKLLPRYKDAEIVRSRDNNILSTCDIVVDVGGVYDPNKHKYDHHMRDFTETFATVLNETAAGFDAKLSSAGLIYCHFGKEIIKHMLPKDTSDSDIDTIFKRIYQHLIKEIDCVDNGIPMHSEEPFYRIRTDISSRVSRLNPAWNSTIKNEDEMFPKAMELTGAEFLYFLHETSEVWLPARSIVKDSLEKRFEVDPSGEIIQLSQFAPWIEQLLFLEVELNISPSIKYAIFESNDSFRVRAVPRSHGSFIPRKPFPESWLGLRDQKLEEVSGINGAIFVHQTGFISGASTAENALEMARKSLAM